MDERYIVGKAQLVSNSGDEAEAKLPSSVLRALFDEVTGTKEYHFSREFRSVVIDRDDVSQLCVSLAQWTDPLRPLSAKFRFVLVERRGDFGASTRTNIPSHKHFMDHDFSGTNAIESLEIYYDFLIDGGNSESSSRYSLNIDLHSFCLDRDEGNALIGMSPEYSPFQSACMEMKVEYTNYLVARNLEVVVRDWFGALDEREIPRQPKWLPNLEPSGNWLRSGKLTISRFAVFQAICFFAPIATAITGNGLLWQIPGAAPLSLMYLLVLSAMFFAYTIFVHFAFVHIANNAWPKGFFPMLVF